MTVHYLKFSSREQMLAALEPFGLDETGHSQHCILPGNMGQIWHQQGDECTVIIGWHANVYLPELPAELEQYRVPATATPFLVLP